jgi:hypothetical protein
MSKPQDTDPVTYTVQITHWLDGDIECRVNDVGDSETDRASVAYALRHAADMVENGDPRAVVLFS